jgi:UDP-N-acetylmuramyl pentapeptide phosphotransferase/UDP-N-acetylglucosamine-1-phosphate transferase
MAGVIVAAIGLLVLLGIVLAAVFALPDDDTKGQNVIALSTSAFGVIGAVVGAYFGVRAANRAVTKLTRDGTRTSTEKRPS